MKTIRDEAFVTSEKMRNGISSFYGVYRNTQTGKIPSTTSFGAPAIDLYGPHLQFGSMAKETGDVSIQK